jgi:hypothetical protein
MAKSRVTFGRPPAARMLWRRSGRFAFNLVTSGASGRLYVQVAIIAFIPRRRGLGVHIADCRANSAENQLIRILNLTSVLLIFSSQCQPSASNRRCARSLSDSEPEGQKGLH